VGHDQRDVARGRLPVDLRNRRRADRLRTEWSICGATDHPRGPERMVTSRMVEERYIYLGRCGVSQHRPPGSGAPHQCFIDPPRISTPARAPSIRLFVRVAETQVNRLQAPC
jgi:hypothetical protein